MDQTQTIFIGIDIAKAHLDIHVHPSGEAWRITHDEENIRELVEKLLPTQAELIVMEATGGLETSLAATLIGAGLPAAVVNPRGSGLCQGDRRIGKNRSGGCPLTGVIWRTYSPRRAPIER